MKTFYTFLAILLAFSFGCKKNKLNPSKEKNIAIISGNQQTGGFNQVLKDSLIVQITDVNGQPLEGEKLGAEYLVGDGIILSKAFRRGTDAEGIASLEWRVGCYDEFQRVMVYTADSNRNLIDSVVFEARVGEPTGWARACGMTENCFDYDGMAIRENDGIFYTGSCHHIYISENGGKDWRKLENPPLITPFNTILDFKFTEDGGIYIISNQDELYFSVGGNIWEDLSIDDFEFYGHIDFMAEDSFLFVSYYSKGVYRSSDNGKSWEALLINGQKDALFKHINRHPNGDLYLFDKMNGFWKSENNGDSWVEVNLEEKYINSGVEDFVIGENGYLYIGAGDASLSILSADTYQGDLYQFNTPDISEQYVNNIQLIDNTVYFNVIGNAEAGIYNSQNWEKLDIDFNYPISGYLLKENGDFLIRSENGIYHLFE